MKLPVETLRMRKDLIQVDEGQELDHLRKLTGKEYSLFLARVEREYYVEIYGTETNGQFIVRQLKQLIRKVLP